MATQSIERRALGGAFAGAAAFGVTLLQGIVAVPILLGFWKVEQYGLWLALQSLLILFQTIDLGHQNYIGNEFYKDLAKGAAHVKRRMASGLRVAFLLGGVEFALALGLVFSGHLAKVLGVDPLLVGSSHAGWAFLSLVGNWVIFGSVAGILVRVYAPFGYFAEAQWIGVVQRLVQFLLLIAVAACGGFVLSYSLVFWFFSIVFALIWFPSLKRRLPELYPWWRGGSWKQAWNNVARSLVLTGNGIIQQLGMNGLPLLVAAQFSASAVPAFTTVRTISNTFSQASLILINPLVPDLVRLHMAGEWEKLIGLFRGCWFVGGSLINLGLVVVTPFIPWLYELWTHGKLPFDSRLFAFLALAVAVRSAYNPLAAYVIGLNHLRAQSTVNLLQTGAMWGIPFLLGSQLGLTAFGLGVAVAECLAAAIYVTYSAKEMGKGPRHLWRFYSFEAFLPVILVSIVLCASCFGSVPSFFTAIVSLVILTGYYWWILRRLPLDLRIRFAKLVPTILRPWLVFTTKAS